MKERKRERDREERSTNKGEKKQGRFFLFCFLTNRLVAFLCLIEDCLLSSSSFLVSWCFSLSLLFLFPTSLQAPPFLSLPLQRKKRKKKQETNSLKILYADSAAEEKEEEEDKRRKSSRQQIAISPSE